MQTGQKGDGSESRILGLYLSFFKEREAMLAPAHRLWHSQAEMESDRRSRTRAANRLLSQVTEEMNKPECPVRKVATKHKLRALEVHVLMAAVYRRLNSQEMCKCPSGHDMLGLLFEPCQIPGLMRLLMPESPLISNGLLVAQDGEESVLDKHYSVLDQVLLEVSGKGSVGKSEPEAGKTLAQEKQSKGPMQIRKQPRFTLGDVVLAPETREKLDLVLTGNASAGTILNDWGLGEYVKYGHGSAVLLYGPPGTGKTLLAEALAGTMGIPFVTVDLPQLVSKFVGETEKNIARVLRYVGIKSNKCVLLIDEADGLLSRRIEDPRSSTDTFRNQELLVFAQEIEKLEAGGSIVILASNSAPSLDPALDRRLMSIEVPMPGPQERMEIWRRFLGTGMPLADDVDCQQLSTAELTGGLIKNAVLSAASRAINRAGKTGEAPLVTMADLLQGVGSARASYRQDSMERRQIGFIQGTNEAARGLQEGSNEKIRTAEAA